MNISSSSLLLAGLVVVSTAACSSSTVDIPVAAPDTSGSTPPTTEPDSASTTGSGRSGTSADTTPVTNPQAAERGAVRSTDLIGTVGIAELQALLDSLQLPGLATASYGISLWQVEYETIAVDGTATTASGTVIVPDGALGPLPIVSDQHGTQTARLGADADLMQREIYLAGVIFASQGYLVVGADYLGLGTNEGVHPYYHADSEASAALDLLVALREVAPRLGVEPGPQLFLTGYSQGAHVTMALHRAIEADDTGFVVTASAPMNGAYALDSVSVPMALAEPVRSTPLYLTYALVGLDQVYDITDDWSTVFQAPFDSQVTKMFDGTKEIGDIIATLPENLDELFQPTFLEDLNAGRGRFAAALRDNNVHDWRPEAPVRLFHGSADVDVPIRNAEVAAARMQELGADVQVVDLGPLDHVSSSMPAYLAAKAWFDEFVEGN